MTRATAAAAVTAIIAAVITADISAQTSLVAVPAGTFVRGAPARSVRMSGFSMMAREVTEGEYGRCVAAGWCTAAHYDDGKCLIWTGGRFRKVTVPEHLRGEGLPVVCVTWQEARAYCASFGAKLPTEAQWEYAALGGAPDAKYSWGGAAPDGSRCALGVPRPVGSFAPNRYGLYDMTGNVWEWTADFYVADYYESADAVDPKGPDAGYYRVIRGGGWYSGPSELRVRNRHWFSANFAEASLGFRCVK